MRIPSNSVDGENPPIQLILVSILPMQLPVVLIRPTGLMDLFRNKHLRLPEGYWLKNRHLTWVILPWHI